MLLAACGHRELAGLVPGRAAGGWRFLARFPANPEKAAWMLHCEIDWDAPVNQADVTVDA
jgi:hypothetical protein